MFPLTLSYDTDFRGKGHYGGTVIDGAKERELIELIRRTGDELKKFWPGDPASELGRTLKVQTKPDGSKVSEADFAANDILVAGIRRLFPDDAIVSEEGPQDEGHRSRSRVWILDPLDGTKSFIESRSDFSVLAALSVDTRVEWGALYFPIMNILGVGRRGGGGEINGERGRVSDSISFRPRSVYYRNFRPVPGAHLFPEWMDSGMAFLELCRGGFDGIIMRMLSHQEWDIAAPAALVEESGGMMTDERGEPIRFNQGKIGFKYLVASNGRLHEDLLKLIPPDA